MRAPSRWGRGRLLGVATLTLMASVAVPRGQASADPRSGAHARDLTLSNARALARQRAPQLLAARASVGLARAEVVRASRWAPKNPQLLVAGGPRVGDDTTPNITVRLMQRLEVTGQRGARVEAAEAGVRAAQASVANRERLLLGRLSELFLRTLHSQKALTLAKDEVRLAKELLRIAKARQEAGEVSVLDVNVAAVTLARQESRGLRLEATHRRLLARLRATLGMGNRTALRLKGDLGASRTFALTELLAAARKRPDLRALAARSAQSHADERRGKRQRWPGLGLFARYGREEQANIFMGGLTFSLPLFVRGQHLRARSGARQRLLSRQKAALWRDIEARLRGELAAYGALRRARKAFESRATARLKESLGLAQKSYQAGSTTLSALLVLRRELLGSRRAFLALQLEVALAQSRLEVLAGDFR